MEDARRLAQSVNESVFEVGWVQTLILFSACERDADAFCTSHNREQVIWRSHACPVFGHRWYVDKVFICCRCRT